MSTFSTFLIKLYRATGAMHAMVKVAVDSRAPPRVIIADELCFALAGDGEYRETKPYVVPVSKTEVAV